MRILSLDGGGIRGALTAAILARIELAIPGGFLQYIDLFAGSSTGAILALALAKGMTPSDILKLYEERGKDIFGMSFARPVATGGGLWAAKYDNAGLKKALQDTYGNTKLGDLGKKVAITTCDLDSEDDSPGEKPRSWRFKVMHNFPGSEDMEISLVNGALRSGAAPTFLPAHQGYVDGGIAANNPSMVAATEAVKRGSRKEDTLVLSLGTGRVPKWIEGSPSLGLVGWGGKIVDFLMTMSSDAVHHQCKVSLNGNYARVNPVLDKDVPLDDAGSVQYLEEVSGTVDLTAAVYIANRMKEMRA